MMCFIAFSFQPINNHPENFSRAFNAFYMAFSRAVFVFSFTLFIFPILLGRWTFMRNVLGHDFWTPLARISFGAYLIHPTFMTFDSFNRPRATWSSINVNITMFFAWWAITYITSFLFTILIETPCANLEKTFLMGGGGRGKKKAPKKMMEVPMVSYENSFSKGFVPRNGDSDNSPIKPREGKPNENEESEDYWNQSSPRDTTTSDINPSFVKHSINT